MFDDFKSKSIYQKSKHLYSILVNLVDKPVPYALKDQILRASISIILNFSEGYGRFHKNDKKNFYINARASLNEVVACFDLIQIHVDVSEENKTIIELLFDEIAKMLSGLINSLK